MSLATALLSERAASLARAGGDLADASLQLGFAAGGYLLGRDAPRAVPLSKISRQTVGHVLSVLLPRLLVMIPALFAAVASMVVAIVAFIAVVSHQEMDDRNRRLSICAVVVGTVATLLSVCLNPEMIRPILTCLAYVLAILVIGIAAKVAGVATKVSRVVVQVRPKRQRQNSVPDGPPPGTSSGKPLENSSAAHSPNSQNPDADARTTGSAP
jgi:hypothetical protein